MSVGIFTWLKPESMDLENYLNLLSMVGFKKNKAFKVQKLGEEKKMAKKIIWPLKPRGGEGGNVLMARPETNSLWARPLRKELFFLRLPLVVQNVI